MGLIIRVTESKFIQAFEDAGRGENFTPEALSALFTYFEETTDGGEGVELDVVSICCDFSEYEVPLNKELADFEGEDDEREGEEYANLDDTAAHHGIDVDSIVISEDGFVITLG
jgi:hypothetical protein